VPLLTTLLGRFHAGGPKVAGPRIQKLGPGLCRPFAELPKVGFVDCVAQTQYELHGKSVKGNGRSRPPRLAGQTERPVESGLNSRDSAGGVGCAGEALSVSGRLIEFSDKASDLACCAHGELGSPTALGQAALRSRLE
jgi:hypothetical protein